MKLQTLLLTLFITELIAHILFIERSVIPFNDGILITRGLQMFALGYWLAHAIAEKND